MGFFKKIAKVLKATNPITKPGEHTKMVHDPAGVFHTSDNPDVAAHQAKLDIGGYGAKKTLLYRAEEAKANEELVKQRRSLLSAQQDANAMLAKRKNAMLMKQRGRASLLSGNELGLSNTLG